MPTFDQIPHLERSERFKEEQRSYHKSRYLSDAMSNHHGANDCLSYSASILWTSDRQQIPSKTLVRLGDWLVHYELLSDRSSRIVLIRFPVS